MNNKGREGTCFSAYLCVSVCVTHISAIVSHSLEAAAERSRKITVEKEKKHERRIETLKEDKTPKFRRKLKTAV